MKDSVRILVTGANGQLGSELRELSGTSGHQFIFTDVDELDLTDPTAVEAFLKTFPVDYCINCAAYTAVDKAEVEKEMAWNINVSAVNNLARACQASGTLLIHISTDFIFNGHIPLPRIETDQPDPVNYYGITKLEGEKKAFSACKKTIIIRTSWLYSSYGNNFVKTMLRLSRENKNLRVIYDQAGSPTYARDLAKALMVVISTVNRSGKEDWYGIYHYSNEGIASWYDFACAIFDIKQIEIKPEPILTSEYPTPAQRPAYSVMDKTKIKTTFSLQIPYWKDSLKQCLDLL